MFFRKNKKISDLERQIESLEDGRDNLLRGFFSIEVGHVSIQTTMIGLRYEYPKELFDIETRQEWAQSQLLDWIEAAKTKTF